ncbi:MAG: tetratricopeptide repeat protein [Bacteroidia bacterium]
MFKNKKRNWQLSLIGIVAFLLIALTWLGLNNKKARYDKPIMAQEETLGEANIFALLHRFSGTNEKINMVIEKLEKDSLNQSNIENLKSIGANSKIEVFTAYASYLEGILNNDNKLLLNSANLFFEAGTHDPDSMADKTTYSVYAVRACDRVLKNDPKNLAALTRKGTAIVYFGGQVMQGVGLLKEAESIDSNYIDAQHYLMLLDLQSGQLEKAKKRLKKLLHLQPENSNYRDILLKLETQQIK